MGLGLTSSSLIDVKGQKINPRALLEKELLDKLSFKDLSSLGKALDKISRKKPTVLEYIDKISLNDWNKKYQNKEADVDLLVGFEKHKNITNIKSLKCIKIANKDIKKVFTSRGKIFPNLKKSAAKKHLALPSGLDDVTFHSKDSLKVIKSIKNYANKKKLKIAVYGHIGVGSLHVRPFIDTKKYPKIDTIAMDIFKILRKYNGTLIGEHNSGPHRSKYLKLESKKMYAYMKKVKMIFDPKNILNPEVIFGNVKSKV